MFRIIYFIFIFFCGNLLASQGIAVACSDKYFSILRSSLKFLREELKSTLPVEVWYAGSELNPLCRDSLETIEGVITRDLMDFLPPPEQEYWGWHVKPLVLDLCSFDEVILADADVYFFQDPRVLFEYQGYRDTGAFFFRDRRTFLVPWQASKVSTEWAKQRGSISFYKTQRDYIRRLIPVPSESLPDDWRHYWSDEIPTKKRPFVTEKMEAGCVVFDKTRHRKGLENIIHLNAKPREIYSFVYGDKETYWIGLEMAKEPYYVNPKPAYSLQSLNERMVGIVQFLEGNLIYQQKWPIKVNKKSKIIDHFEGERKISHEELQKFQKIYEARSKL